MTRKKRWSAEYAALRQLCLASGLNEELKWGQACYDLSDSNVVLIHGFKTYCALLFMKGALLKDPKGILIQQTRNVRPRGKSGLLSLADINKQKAAVKAYIRDALRLRNPVQGADEKRGTIRYARGVSKALNDDSKLAEAFYALTPGRQKVICCISLGETIGDFAPRAAENHAP